MREHHTFDLGPTRLACGLTVPLRVAWQVHGALNADRSNLILYPTSYGATHADIDWLIGPGRVLDPERFCIVIPNQLGNGVSTSPSTLPHPWAEGAAPPFSHLDNLAAQERLVREELGVDRLALVYGWSMGGQQALHWAVHRPEMVARVCVTCTTARTSPHNRVFLESLKAALTADPGWTGTHFSAHPLRGLRAFGRIYAGWAQGQAFWTQELWREAGFSSAEDFVLRGWEGRFLGKDPMDLISMIDTWIASDVAPGGDLAEALGRIEAPLINLPGTQDLYFTLADATRETAMIPGAELRPIDSAWGHRAGNPQFSPDDEAMLRGAVADLLA